MNIQQEITVLELRLSELRKAQEKCGHVWGNPLYDPKLGYKAYVTGEYECRGSGYELKTAMDKVLVPRWSRTCNNCGKVEYTEVEEEKVVVTRIPKF